MVKINDIFNVVFLSSGFLMMILIGFSFLRLKIKYHFNWDKSQKENTEEMDYLEKNSENKELVNDIKKVNFYGKIASIIFFSGLIYFIIHIFFGIGDIIIWRYN